MPTAIDVNTDEQGSEVQTESTQMALLIQAKKITAEFFDWLSTENTNNASPTVYTAEPLTFEDFAKLDPAKYSGGFQLFLERVQWYQSLNPRERDSLVLDRDEKYRELLATAIWFQYTHQGDEPKVLTTSFDLLRVFRANGVVNERDELIVGRAQSLSDADVKSLIRVYSVLGCTFGNRNVYEQSRKFHEAAACLVEILRSRNDQDAKKFSGMVFGNSLSNRIVTESAQTLSGDFEELLKTWGESKHNIVKNLGTLCGFSANLLTNGCFDDVIDFLEKPVCDIKHLNQPFMEKNLRLILRNAYVEKGLEENRGASGIGEKYLDQAKELRGESGNEKGEHAYLLFDVWESFLTAQEDLEEYRQHPEQAAEWEPKIISNLKHAEGLSRQHDRPDLLSVVLRIWAQFYQLRAVNTPSKTLSDLERHVSFKKEAEECVLEAWELNESAYGKTLEQMEGEKFLPNNCRLLRQTLETIFPEEKLSELRKKRSVASELRHAMKLIGIFQERERLSASTPEEKLAHLKELLSQHFQAQYFAVRVDGEVLAQNFLQGADHLPEHVDGLLDDDLGAGEHFKEHRHLWMDGRYNNDKNNLAFNSLLRIDIPSISGENVQVLIGRDKKIAAFSETEKRLIGVLLEGAFKNQEEHILKVLTAVIAGFYREMLGPTNVRKARGSRYNIQHLGDLHGLNHVFPQLLRYLQTLVNAKLSEVGELQEEMRERITNVVSLTERVKSAGLSIPMVNVLLSAELREKHHIQSMADIPEHQDFENMLLRGVRKSEFGSLDDTLLGIHTLVQGLDALPEGSSCVVDWGCGAGLAGFKALESGSTEHYIGFDIDPNTVAVARENAKQLGLEDRCEFILLDTSNPENVKAVLKELRTRGIQVDYFYANLPWVPTREESRLTKTMSAGPDGLDCYNPLLDVVAKDPEIKGFTLNFSSLGSFDELVTLGCDAGFEVVHINAEPCNLTDFTLIPIQESGEDVYQSVSSERATVAASLSEKKRPVYWTYSVSFRKSEKSLENTRRGIRLAKKIQAFHEQFKRDGFEAIPVLREIEHVQDIYMLTDAEHIGWNVQSTREQEAAELEVAA